MTPWPKIATGMMALFLLAACARAPAPLAAAGAYRFDYSGVYGVGRIDLFLADGKVSGLDPDGAGPSYRGLYRQAADSRQVQLDLTVHLPATRQSIGGVTVIGTARDFPVRFTFPASLGLGQRWPIRIETQAGRISGEISRQLWRLP